MLEHNYNLRAMQFCMDRVTVLLQKNDNRYSHRNHVKNERKMDKEVENAAKEYRKSEKTKKAFLHFWGKGCPKL